MNSKHERKCSKWKQTLIILASSLVLAGCGWFGFGGDEPIEPGSVEEARVELSFVTENGHSQLEKELIRQFEEEYPGIKIKTAAFNNWPQVYLREQEPPDLLNVWSGEWLNIGLQEELIADLSDVWEQGELGENYSAQLAALTERGGRQYYLPTGYDWRAIYYNREIFNRYDLQPPQSWDELITVADTLKANGEFAFALPQRNEWLSSLWFDYLNIRLNGPEFHQGLSRGEESFTDGRVREVFVLWGSMFERDYFATDLGSGSSLNALTALVRGDADQPLTREKAAMTLISSFDLKELPEVFQDELDFFRFPILNPDLPLGEVVNANGLVVPAKALNRQDALKFVAFMAQAETQQFTTQFLGPETNFVPAGSVDFGQLPISTQQGTMLIERADYVTLPYMWSVPSSVRIAMDQSISRFRRRSKSDDPIDYDEILDPLEEARIKALDQGEFFE